MTSRAGGLKLCIAKLASPPEKTYLFRLRAGSLRLCIAGVASTKKKIIFIEVFKFAEGLKLILPSCKSRLSPQGEKMYFTGIALSNMPFPGFFFCKAPVHRGFSTPGNSDITQTSMLGKKLSRGIRQLKKKKKK